MITDPRFAPRRNDLPWLRRRRLPKSAQAPAAPAGAAAPSAPAAAPLRDFLSGRDTHHRHDEPAAPPARPAPSQRPTPAAPAASSSLDLDAPSAPAPGRPPVSSSLDLDAPAASPPPPAPARPSTSSSLDLDEAPAGRPVTAPASTPNRRRREDVRVRSGERLILNPTEPTVTLTPLQSGIGTLTVEAACSPEVGDLRLGCAYELASGLQTTVQMTQGNRFAPPHSKRPVIVGGHDRFERVSLDLRQCRSLRRLVVYGFSEGRRPINWGGTLVTTTYGGGRVEVPLEVLQGGDIAVLLSIYQVRGELVLRAEMQALLGDVREAARAYGYDKISWLDDRTPVE